MAKIKRKGVQAFRQEVESERIKPNTLIYIPNPRRDEPDLSYIVIDKNNLAKGNKLQSDKNILPEQEKYQSFNSNQILSNRGWYIMR